MSAAKFFGILKRLSSPAMLSAISSEVKPIMTRGKMKRQPSKTLLKELTSAYPDAECSSDTDCLYRVIAKQVAHSTLEST